MTLTPISAASATSVNAALRNAVMQGLPISEARSLLEAVLKLSRSWLVAHPEFELDGTTRSQFEANCTRRLLGEPLAYILGRREFYGRSFQVNPDVLIPRPETELLIELALQLRLALPPAPRVVDLGTGSGVIAISLALEAAAQNWSAQISACDFSAAALACAQSNAEQLGAQITCVQSNWWQNLGGQRFDLVISNPPYIRAGDTHLAQGDLRFEPAHALTDEADGLSAYRTICAGLSQHLAPGGWVLFEHGYDQADQVCAILSATDLAQVQSWPDLAGIPRVSGGSMR